MNSAATKCMYLFEARYISYRNKSLFLSFFKDKSLKWDVIVSEKKL
jgi:hypothetical protein